MRGMHARLVEKATYQSIDPSTGCLQPQRKLGPQLINRHPLLGVEGVGRRLPSLSCSAVFRTTQGHTWLARRARELNVQRRR